jgi:3-phenylpropionate/cinnamic acid dioxygenase small subunit
MQPFKFLIIGCISTVIAATSISIAHAAKPTALEARIQRIEDRAEIERLLLEYGRSLDNRDFATYASLFAESGEWKGALGSYRGPAAIKAAMEKIFTDAASDIPQGSNYHLISNVIIDVDGDRATASSKFMFLKMEKSKPDPVVAGRYEDVLIREKGVWKFLQRVALPPVQTNVSQSAISSAK